MITDITDILIPFLTYSGFLKFKWVHNEKNLFDILKYKQNHKIKSCHPVIICLRVMTSNSISVLNLQYLHVSKTTIVYWAIYIFIKVGVFLGNCIWVDEYRIIY